MAPQRDPVERRADEETDLHGVATWEVRSVFDRVPLRCHIRVSGPPHLTVWPASGTCGYPGCRCRGTVAATVSANERFFAVELPVRV